MKKELLLLGALSPIVVAQAKESNKIEKPNIIVILADDLGWGDLGFKGSDNITPNLDELANKGVVMDKFYTAPVSSPTRAGFLTGRYPNRFGIRTAVIPPWREDGLDANEETIADMLGSNGYENRAIIGKWHLGHTYKEHYPMSRGFTHFYGCLNGAVDYFTHEREGELDWHNDWEPCYDKGYATDILTDEAVRCINEYKENGPFFMYLAYNAPHTPLAAKEEDMKLYAKDLNSLSKKEKQIVTYKAMVTCLDRGIGRVVDELEKQGLMDNTLLVFFSDNGANLSVKGASSAPLRAGKFYEWDGGVKSPAIIYWKKAIGNYENMQNQLTGFVDLMPTIKEIVGDNSKPKREFDGMSMLPVISGDKKTIDREFYLGCGAVVNGDYKLIRSGFNPRMKLQSDILIDYKSDKYEENDVANDNLPMLNKLKQTAVKYDTITPFLPEVPYDLGKKGFKAPKEWRVTKEL